MVLRSRLLALVFAAASCAAPQSSRGRLQPVALAGPLGESVELPQAARKERLTVLVFFSPHCHCLDAHGPRLEALYAEYAPRGVQFFMIDSEMGASRDRDDAERRKRGYPYPVLLDRGGKLADLVGAEYATFSVVLDPDGRVRYHGGIDTDKTHLREDATPLLKNAIDDLLAGRAPRVATGNALGCALEKW
jgi:thiol-disulfide isomerase/thioredoxin